MYGGSKYSTVSREGGLFGRPAIVNHTMLDRVEDSAFRASSWKRTGRPVRDEGRVS
jgi:hypothetical protein